MRDSHSLRKMNEYGAHSHWAYTYVYRNKYPQNLACDYVGPKLAPAEADFAVWDKWESEKQPWNQLPEPIREACERSRKHVRMVLNNEHFHVEMGLQEGVDVSDAHKEIIEQRMQQYDFHAASWILEQHYGEEVMIKCLLGDPLLAAYLIHNQHVVRVPYKPA